MKKLFKTVRRIIFVMVLIASVCLGLLIKTGYDKYAAEIAQNPLDTVISRLKMKENYTSYADVPQIYFDALVAVEDRRFYMHNGFEVIGTTRAVYNDIKNKQLLEGGSTISQQLAKNLYFPQDNTLVRKIAEIFMALEMEKTYEKTEILEFYVNAVYYGSGHYCIYDASVGYFGKKPAMMTAYECTLLAGIPNAPSVYSLNVNPDLAHQRQKKVVSCMTECGYITKTEAEEILMQN